MDILFVIIIILVLVFSFVIFFGAPYLPTLKKQTAQAFELLDLKPGQTLVELGSGDGRVLRYAAKQGVRGIGYELNPILVWYSQLANWRYRKLITFKCRNYWQVKLPECDAVYTFLLDKYMEKLDTKIMHETTKPIKLVTFAFKIPGKKALKTKNALFLYEYK